MKIAWSLLGLSLLGNAFLLLRSSGEDAVRVLSRPEIAVRVSAARNAPMGSAVWDSVLVESPQLIVVEHASLVNFRAFFRPNVKRTIYIVAPEKRGSELNLLARVI